MVTKLFPNHTLDPVVKVYVGRSTKYESSLSSITTASMVFLVSSTSDDENIAVTIPSTLRPLPSVHAIISQHESLGVGGVWAD